MLLARSFASALLVMLAFSAAVAAPAATLRANYSSQVVMNERADRDHLSRMEDKAMIARWARLELIKPVPTKARGYYLHSVSAENRYLRPWAKTFLDRLSSQYRARFGKQLRVTSLVRTAEYQQRLQRRNGNAAQADGPRRSSHLTGASLDISKKGMTSAQRNWVRRVLQNLRGKGYLYAIEEHQQPVFHVMVYRKYLDYVKQKTGR